MSAASNVVLMHAFWFEVEHFVWICFINFSAFSNRILINFENETFALRDNDEWWCRARAPTSIPRWHLSSMRKGAQHRHTQHTKHG